MDETPSRPIERRDALKKAAVAGAIVWTAPTVLSATVLAQSDACTAKCGPVVGSGFNGQASRLSCEAQGPLFQQHPSNWTLGPVTSPGSACGCGGSPTITLEGTSLYIGNNDWVHEVCDPRLQNDLHIGHVGRIGSNPNPNPVPVFATITCTDRTGRSVCRRCEIGGTFTYCHQAGINFFTPCDNANFPALVTINYTILDCEAVTCC